MKTKKRGRECHPPKKKKENLNWSHQGSIPSDEKTFSPPKNVQSKR